ncbi:MAG: hypothetical protein P4L51_16595 [Puia sp.]|nr:hypothetical protein [Puia sp.]
MNSLIAEEIAVVDDKSEIQQLKSVKEYIMTDAMFEGKKSRSMGLELSEVKRLQNIVKNKLLINR